MTTHKTVWVGVADYSKRAHVTGVYDSLEAVMQAYPDLGLFVSPLVGGVFVGKNKDESAPVRFFRHTLHHFTEED